MAAITLGFLLALGQCLAIGPVSAEALRRGLHGGFRPALAVELGSCLGDGLWAVLAIVGVGALLTLQFMDTLGSLLGVALLSWLAVQSWREASPSAFASVGAVGQQSQLPAFWAGVLLSVVNPGSAAFWVGIGATVLSTHLAIAGPATLMQFAIGYYTELIIWSFAFALVAWQLRIWLPAVMQVWIQRGMAVILGCFAAVSLVAKIRNLHASRGG